MRLLFLMEGSFRGRVVDALDGEPPKSDPTTFGSPAARRIRQLLSDAEASGVARSVVVESEYVDRDSNIAFAQLYARAFRDQPRRTTRLHFFECQLDGIDDLHRPSTQEAYLGFCVLSPVPPRTIGRTVLRVPGSGGAKHFVPGASAFSINVAGINLQPEGAAFLQQDGRVAACASAAMWMSATSVARRFDLPIHPVADITNFATRYSPLEAGAGSDIGLTVSQMLMAFREMGYEPHLHDEFDEDPRTPGTTSRLVTELIYRYVESGIPPILVLEMPNRGRHAVTVVGHAYDPAMSVLAPTSTSDWSPYFLVHDDQMGPYLKLKIGSVTPGAGAPSVQLVSADEPEDTRDWYKGAYLSGIIAPMPPRHTLRPEEVTAKARSVLVAAYILHGKDAATVLPAPLVLRTYLTSSNEFRSGLRARQGLADTTAAWYEGSSYPRYIWVTEFCSVDHRAQRPVGELRILGEVAIDPTSHPHSLDFVTLHIPGRFFRMPPEQDQVREALRVPVAVIDDDRAYEPLIRGPKLPPS